ncbi:hypothetical protein HDV00_009364 [Rhizophlyctis rosea]|nr:hypothetical protein HDV00_009364 [Rhizophlyctis rosea]
MKSKYSGILTSQHGAGRVAWDVNTAEPAKVLDLEATAAAMLQRSTTRRANGRYKRKAQKAQIVGVVVTALLFLSLIGAGISIISPTGGVSVTVGQWSGLAVLAAVFVILFFVIKMSLMVRWYFYWLVLAIVVLLIINKGQLAPGNVDSSIPVINRVFTGANITVIVCLISVQLLTLIATLVRRVLYPYLIRNISPSSGIEWWWIRPILVQPGTFQYTIYDPWAFSTKNRTFSYTGSVNADGRPHGYGMWCDDAEDGEVTMGYWKNGHPVPPFKAREFGSGDSFTAIKIGFATCSKLGLDEYNLIPQVDDGVRYGVAGVECSISGRFFAELPRVTFPLFPAYRDAIIDNMRDVGINPESSNGPLDHVLQELENAEFAGLGNSPYPVPGARPTPGETNPSLKRRREKSVVKPIMVGVDETNRDITVEGFRRVDGNLMSPSEASVTINKVEDSSGEVRLVPDGWEPVDDVNHAPQSQSTKQADEGSEALIFVHGYVCKFAPPITSLLFRTDNLIPSPNLQNCSTTEAIKRLGQLLTLGNFPPHIKPFVFSWPPGRELTYFQAKKAGAHPAVLEAFVTFVGDLRRAGVRRVHLLSHSAGCGVVMGFAGVFERCFVLICALGIIAWRFVAVIPYRTDVSYPRLYKQVPLTDFLETQYMTLRRYCSLITCYVDENDGALFWAEKGIMNKVLGRNPGNIYTVVPVDDDDQHSPADTSGSEIMTGAAPPGVGWGGTLPSRVHTVFSTQNVFGSSVDRSEEGSEGVMMGEIDVRTEYAEAESGRSSVTTTHSNTTHPLQHQPQQQHRWNHSLKPQTRRLVSTLMSPFWSAHLPSSGADATPAPEPLLVRGNSFERRHEKVQREVREEIGRLRPFLNERRAYAKEVVERGFGGVAGRGRGRGRYLVYPDMDTIDTSLLDVNIHSLRHAYFNLNRMFVDDLLDIIVHQKRASERTSRLAPTVQGGLVYQFLCAPSYVINP